MIRINVSYSPNSVTLFHDHEVIDHYTGDISTWIYKLVQDAYTAGVKDATSLVEPKQEVLHQIEYSDGEEVVAAH